MFYTAAPVGSNQINYGVEHVSTIWFSFILVPKSLCSHFKAWHSLTGEAQAAISLREASSSGNATYHTRPANQLSNCPITLQRPSPHLGRLKILSLQK